MAPNRCDRVTRIGAGSCCSPFVFCAGVGQPLVEPDGLVSVGTPRGQQSDGQIDVGGTGGAQVRKARAGELGAELAVLGRGDVLCGQRVRAGDQTAILRRGEAGLASAPRSRAGTSAAAPIAERRVRVDRFLSVGGRCAARRSDMAGVPFFRVRASVRG